MVQKRPRVRIPAFGKRATEKPLTQQWVENQGRIRQRKEGDRLRLHSAVSKIQWASVSQLQLRSTV